MSVNMAVEKKGRFIEEIQKQFSTSAKYGVLVGNSYLEIPDINFTEIVYRSESLNHGIFISGRSADQTGRTRQMGTTGEEVGCQKLKWTNWGAKDVPSSSPPQ